MEKKLEKIISKNGKIYYSNCRRFRKVIFARDNWQCQSCGSTQNLELHHIKAEIGEGKKIWWEKRNNNPENLITFCRKCHRKIDEWKRIIGLRKKWLYQWSQKFPKCLICGTIKRKHYARGLCSSCYEKTRREYKKEYWRKHYALGRGLTRVYGL